MMAAPGTCGLIAGQAWLLPVEDTLRDAIRKAFRSGGPTGQKIKNLRHGTWLGHPCLTVHRRREPCLCHPEGVRGIKEG